MALAGPGVGLRGLQHQGEHQRRGGHSGQRRLTRTLPRMPGVSTGWFHVVLDSVSSWGGDPPARLRGADDSRETDSGRGDSARRPPPSTHASEFTSRTTWRPVRHGAPGDRPPPAGGPDGLDEHRLRPPRAPLIARHQGGRRKRPRAVRAGGVLPRFICPRGTGLCMCWRIRMGNAVPIPAEAATAYVTGRGWWRD